MKRFETAPDIEIFDDLGPAEYLKVEQNPVMNILFDAKDIVLGGFNYLRQHPIGSVEVGSALAASGAILGAKTFRSSRARHAH